MLALGLVSAHVVKQLPAPLGQWHRQVRHPSRAAHPAMHAAMHAACIASQHASCCVKTSVGQLPPPQGLNLMLGSFGTICVLLFSRPEAEAIRVRSQACCAGLPLRPVRSHEHAAWAPLLKACGGRLRRAHAANAARPSRCAPADVEPGGGPPGERGGRGGRHVAAGPRRAEPRRGHGAGAGRHDAGGRRAPAGRCAPARAAPLP